MTDEACAAANRQVAAAGLTALSIRLEPYRPVPLGAAPPSRRAVIHV